ncbi:MAG: hypothetical protein EXX96DRAFT_25025 [Benjaminiella poitrasii]|nr:MAG: hypothetical protein EXX96DRAFT_25025 [Benjaminiella poitrasii]
MAVAIFSVIGVVCAFLGLSVFLISLISLLPVNIYNSTMAFFALRKILNSTLNVDSNIATLFFSGTILIAFVSSGLFYFMTTKKQEDNSTTISKTDMNYGSTDMSTQHSILKLSNTKPSVLAKQHRRHHLLNVYSISFVIINIVWGSIGYILLKKAKEALIEETVISTIHTQVFILWTNLFVLAVAVTSMELSSLFFFLGKKKGNPTYPALMV